VLRTRVTPPFTPPSFKVRAFNCPLCNAFANQQWLEVFTHEGSTYAHQTTVQLARCAHCRRFTIWQDGRMIFPDSSSAPLPNSDLPEDIHADYEEARSIINRSARGAAALLRLCIQKLCKHLGLPGKDINRDIGALVKQGLNPTIQKSLDIVRVIGNEAVHPGQIDLRDKPETAVHLCQLINIIADAMITQPKMIEELYTGLPDAKREQIEKRDADPGT
jgi:hypothetical protein